VVLFFLPHPCIFFTLKPVPPSILHHFGDGPSSPELNEPSSLHGLGVANTRVLSSEHFKDDDKLKLENSESDEESDSEDSSCM